jgi:Ice-binding-like/IPTL-CTERM motif
MRCRVITASCSHLPGFIYIMSSNISTAQFGCASLLVTKCPQKLLSLLASAGLAALLSLVHSNAALAAMAPSLGTTSPYGVVSETFSNTNPTVVNGALCYTTGTAPSTITGATTVPCPAATGTDQNAALANLNSQLCTSLGAAVELNAVIVGANPPGTLPPGCYSSTGAMSITTGTTLTLSGAGVYIFRSGGALDPMANSNVVMTGGACQSDVFWAPNGGTTIGANANFVGNVFRGAAAGLSITLGTASTLIGRALAYGSTVTTATNTSITVPTCASFGTGTASIPTLSEWVMIVLASLMAMAGFAAMRRRTI